MLKIKTTVLLVTFLLVLSACNASTASTPEQSVELPPTPYPDTPAPAEIDVPLVEAPALVNFHFINELDGWGVTETQIVRTNDGGITWYNVTPPDVTETGYSVRHFVLDVNHSWARGERRHEPLRETKFRWRELLRALKDMRVGGWVVCESPSMEDDAVLLQRAFKRLK